MFYFISLFLFCFHHAFALDASDKTIDVEVMPDDGTNLIHLSWTHHDEATQYRVYRRL